MPKVVFHPDHPEHQLFWKAYMVENWFHSSQQIDGKKVFWGHKGVDQKCRFCGKDKSQTTFRNDTHLIPYLMGNSLLFSHFECDKCNSLFSKYENELGNFEGIRRTISQLSGRKGVPEYKDVANRFTAFLENGILKIQIVADGSLSKDEFMNKYKAIQIDAENRKIKINTKRPSFVPRDVLRCFVKIGIAMLNESNVSRYQFTRKWLLKEVEESEIPSHPCFFIFKKWNSINFRTPMVMLLCKTKSDFAAPDHVLLVFYGHLIYQVFLPFCSNDEWLLRQEKIHLIVENRLVTEKKSLNPLGAADITVLDMSSTTKQKGVDDNLSFGVAY